ncbi:hypothetical protein L7F22_049573 [Adiantum nelumboides]|nr:hypothetical protein [Adiantum nelumboides]
MVLSLGDRDLDWSGYRQVALPTVLQRTSDAINSSNVAVSQQAFRVCALVQQQNQLHFLATATPTPALARWSNVVSTAVLERLSGLKSLFEENKGAEYGQDHVEALALAPLFKAQAEAMASLLSSLVVPLSAMCMASEGGDDRLPWPAQLPELVNSLAWHRAALLAYTRLCLAGANKFQQVNFVSLDDVAESLNGPLMGSDEALRLAASRLLALAGASSGAGSFLDGIVDIEQTALSVETIRERNVRTRALSRELLRLSASGEAKEKINLLVSIAVRYLVSTMRLNFMPLWEESRKALAELAPRFGGEVWKVAFDELKKPASIGRQVLQITPQESGEQSGEVGYAEDFEGEETAGKQFRDPLLKERRDAVDHFIRDARIAHSGSTTISLSQLADAQRPRGRLDFVNYQSQILKLFSSIHSVAERNNGPLMLHFFHTVASRAPLSEDDVEVERAEGETDEDNMVKLTVLERRTQLCAYLETFAHFSNPKALFRAKDLYSFLLTLARRETARCRRCPGLHPDVEGSGSHDVCGDPQKLPRAFQVSRRAHQPRLVTEGRVHPEGSSTRFPGSGSASPLWAHDLERGRLSSGSGASGRKMAILGALSECSAEELQTLVDLMLAPLQDQRPSFDDSGRFVFQRDGAPQASRKRQAGYLSLLGDVIKHLSLKLQPQWAQLIGVTLNLTYHASLAAESGQGKATLPDRAIRQTGLKRIADFFRQPTEYDWSAFLPALFEQLISPRLSLLKVESIQSPSAILDLIHTWSARSDTIFLLVEHEETLLDHVSACLAVPSVKPPVISKILDIIERALSFANDQVAEGQENVAEAVKDKVLRPHISPLIQSVAPLVQRCSGASGVEAKTMGREELLRRLLRLLADLAPLVSTADDASLLLELLGPMLRKSNALIPERSKTDLLQIFQDLLLLCPSFQDPSSETFSRHYDLFSSLFAILRSREARLQLGSVLRQFARIDGSLDRVTGWAEDLNAFSKRRIDEADFDRRLGAFDAINDERSPPNPSISAREWLPIVHNMIYFIQDADELAIRSNAGMTLRNFIDAVVATSYPVELKTIFSTVVYPGIRRALRSRHELVRREVLSVIGHAAEKLDRYEHLAEMRGLLAGGDDEANFFYNIHHLQIHRRARALRRLGDEAEKGSLKSKTISDVFAPLVGQFLFEENVEKSDHHLVNDAVVCLGRLTSQLQWGPYNAQLWKYLGLASKDKEHEKIFVRAAMAILDNFHFDMDEQALLDEAAADGDEDAEDGEERAEEEIDAGMQVDDEEQKTKAVAQSRKVLGAVTNRLLPKLMGYLNQKEDAEDTVRLPLAVGIVRVMQRLPVESRDLQIRKLLNTMANVFRSKSQETRDLAREALSRVALSLGPSYFAMLVHELRRALTRGPQLAVLAYTVHNILVNMMAVPYEDEKRDHLTLLDEGVADVVHVAAEDIFGHTAEDREANEHYRSKTREMRQSKSVDTFEQLAKVVAPKQMTTVLAPVRDIMQQTEAQRAVRGIDGVLKRIAAARKKEKVDGDKDLPPNHTVLLKRRDVEKGQTNRDHFSRNVHRFVAFGLDMLITALRRNRFDVADAGTRSRLEPMVSSVANCLYAPEVDLVTLALKAVGSLVKLGSETLPSLQKGLPLIVKQTIKLVQSEGGTQSDVSQAALKMLSVVMREDEVDFSEQHLADLCHLIVSDLEEPAVQSTLFALLKSIVGRRFVVAQVYDAMDKVAEMLVTNQTSSVRETCRSLFLQFLLDYPQGKKRLSNQMHFLAKNVSYTYESGRLSVMELIRVVLAKFDATLLKDYLDVFFVALVMVLANDDSAPCRDEAAKLITTIVTLSESSDGELGENGIGKLVRLTHAWAEQSDKPALARVAVQTYGLLLDGAPAFASAWVPRATKNASKLLGQCVEQLEEVERKGTPAESMGQDIVAQLDLDWQLPYQTMQTLSKLYKREDCRSLLDDANIWADVRGLLLFPHSWVRIAACRLLASLFAHADQEVVVDRLRGSGEDEALGLVSLVDAARKMALQLKSPQLEEDLGLQIVKNLVFLGRCFAPISKSIVSKDQEVFVDETDAVVDDGDHEDSEEESVDEGPDKPEAEEERETEQGWRENPLAWLFSKLSYQARTARLHGELNNSVSGAGSVRGTKAILQWMLRCHSTSPQRATRRRLEERRSSRPSCPTSSTSCSDSSAIQSLRLSLRRRLSPTSQRRGCRLLLPSSPKGCRWSFTHAERIEELSDVAEAKADEEGADKDRDDQPDDRPGSIRAPLRLAVRSRLGLREGTVIRGRNVEEAAVRFGPACVARRAHVDDVRLESKGDDDAEQLRCNNRSEGEERGPRVRAGQGQSLLFLAQRSARQTRAVSTEHSKTNSVDCKESKDLNGSSSHEQGAAHNVKELELARLLLVSSVFEIAGAQKHKVDEGDDRREEQDCRRL